MSDVFVSYKAEDRRRVKPLVEALEADGYSVWWDEQIGGGAQWRHMIEAELNAAKCVIVAWSKRSVGPDGTFVQDEATRAQQRHVYIPVLIDKVHLPLGFGEMQALPLSGWKGDRSDPHYQAILSAVNRIAGDSARAGGPAAPPPPQTGIDRRTVVAGGAVATAAVVGIGGWALLKPGAAGASADSIAVLPFANLSGDPAQAYFSDGIAEELRSALARVAGLKVVGRTSSEAVRNDDAETAAKKLGVDSILTGSVRQSPSTIRVGAQLVDGRSGLEKWSENYDRPPGDAIKIQTDIAENVARALSVALGNAGRAAITAGGTNNVQAQKLMLQGMQVGRGSSGNEIQRAIALMDGAIALDPNYAEAVAQKAILQNVYASTFADGVPVLMAYRNESLKTANIALQLAPDLSTTHRAKAEIYRSVLNLPAAMAEYRRALDLAPGDAGTIRDYATFINRLGRQDESLQLADKALSLDRLNPFSYDARLAALMGGRRYAEAVQSAEELQRTSPDLFDWPEAVGLCLVLLGRFADAQKYLDRARAGSYFRLVAESALLVRTGRRGEVESRIEKIRQLYGDAASYQYGEIYAQLGDKDRAFAALNRAWQIRDSGLMNLKVDELLDPLRGDPRFSELFNRVGFPA